MGLVKRCAQLRGSVQRGKLMTALSMVFVLVLAACSSTARQAAPGESPDSGLLSEDSSEDALPPGAHVNKKGQVINKKGEVIGTAEEFGLNDGGSGGGTGNARAGGSGGSNQSTGGSSGAPAAAGTGVTDDSIKLGFIYVNRSQANALYDSLGAGQLDAGPQREAAEAMIKYFNSHGGLAGLKIEPVWSEFQARGQINYPEVEREWCAKFTEDNKVFAVISNLYHESSLSCFAEKETMLLNDDTGIRDAQEFKKYAGYYYAPGWFDLALNARSYVDALVEQDYFKGPTTKVGLVYFDAPWYERASRIVEQRLNHHGLELTEKVAGRGLENTSWAGNGVVRFRTSGVTHVLILDFRSQMILVWTEAAESQEYRPRYGLNSTSLWGVSTTTVPRRQLERALGVGHRPVDDVSSRNHNQAVQRCLAIFRRAGVELKGSNALRYSLTYCDMLFFMQEGLRGSVPNAKVLWNGVADLGTSYQSPLTFGTRFGPRYGLGGPTQVRHAAYKENCTCFRYTSGLIKVR